MQDKVKAGMLCPICRVDLMMSERQGVEIDYCPQCRGVWLDRGELDKVIERSTEEDNRPPAAPQQQYREPPGYHEGSKYTGGGYGREPYGRKKKSWLSEIFD